MASDMVTDNVEQGESSSNASPKVHILETRYKRLECDRCKDLHRVRSR
jgi:hypothetical protein